MKPIPYDLEKYATNYDLWLTHVDTERLLSRQWFNNVSVELKLKMIQRLIKKADKQ